MTIKVRLLSIFLVLFIAAQLADSRRYYRRGVKRNRASPQYYCKDKRDGTAYPPRLNFRRERDGYLCNCTVKATAGGGLRAVMRCQAPRQTFLGHDDTYEVRRVAPENCIYQGRLYELDSAWRMEIDGVMMDCTCDSGGKLKCAYQSTETSTRVTGGNRNVGGGGVYGDPADRKCRSGLYADGEEFAVADPSGFYSICQCVHHVAKCRTVTTTGAECRFPFEVNGAFYSTCTYLGESTEPVCATSRGWGANAPVYSKCIATLQGLQDYFGYVFTTGGNSNGAKCQFPFVANGVTYNECTTVGKNRKWCATTSNYDQDGRYGYCPDGVEGAKIVNMVGNTVVLDCPYEREEETSPELTWYALVDGVRQKIYVYDFATGYGAPVQTAGEFAGRLNMPNARKLEIRNFRETDRKQFECEITEKSTQHYIESQVDVVEREAGPTNLRIVYTPAYGRTEFTWENPSHAYDYMRVEVQPVGEESYRLAKLSPTENRFEVYALRTDTRYEARLFTVSGNDNSEKLIAEFTLPTVADTSVTRVVNGHVEEVPFAREDNQGASIVLTWNPASVENTQMTDWLITTEDVSTGEQREITVDKNEGSTTITGLIPGTTYRITLYAVQGPTSRVQIVSTVVRTEYGGTVEIPTQPTVSSESSSTVKIAWPAAPLATSYKILYSINNSPNWRPLKTIEATNEPQMNVQGLRPGVTYNIKIVPYRDSAPGVARVVSFDLSTVEEEVEEEDQTPLPEPQNFDVTDIDRDTAVLTWDAPDDSRPLQYRVSYQKYPVDDNDQPAVRVTTRTQYPAYGLTGDQSYIFTVTTISGTLESNPTTRVIRTSSDDGDMVLETMNKVCRVNRQWRGNGEQFYKTSSQGYLQNCTCNKGQPLRPLTCSPMVCHYEGEDYLVGMSWNRLNQERTQYDLCSCSHKQGADLPVGLTEVNCVYQKPYVPHYGGDRISESFVQKILRCPFREENALPLVKWYKVLTNGQKNHIYTYDGRRAGGTEESGAGDLAGRVTMPNRHELIINPVRRSDSGTFECVVTYQNSRPVEYLATIRVTPTIKKPNVYITQKPEIRHETPGSVSLNWEPNANVTSYIIQYENLENPSDTRTIVVSNPHVKLDNLAPSATYRLTIIPVIGRAHGSSVNLIISTDNGGVEPEGSNPGRTQPNNSEIQTTPAPIVTTTTAPDVQPPRAVRIPSKTSTSITLDWTPEEGEVIPGTKYRIEWKPVNSDDAPEGATVSNTRYMITNLEPGISYEITLQAIYRGNPSDILKQIIPTNSVDTIDVNLGNITPNLGDSATLFCSFNPLTPNEPNIYWSRTLFNSEDDDEEVVAQYTSNGNVDVSGQFRNKFNLGRGGKVLIINDVTNDDAGSYKCTVEYPVGEGESTGQLIVNGPPQPVEITSPSLGPEESTYTMTWEVVEHSPVPEQFELVVRKRLPDGRTGAAYKRLSPAAIRKFRFSSLEPGSTYEGTIVSINSYGRSQPTPFAFTTSHSGQPDQPTGATIEGIHPTEISIVFYEPPNDRFEHYRIKLINLDQPGSPEKIYDVPGPDRKYTITDLTEDTLYNLAVHIVNLGMESAPIKTNFTTSKIPPPTPTGIKMIESGLTFARFLITAPESDDVIYYRANYRPPNTPKDEGHMVRTPDGSRELLVPLEAGKQYQLDVVAVGHDVESNAISFLLTVPKLVPKLDKVVSTSTTTTVRWRRPTSRTIIRYMIVLVDENGRVVQEDILYPNQNSTNESFTFENLQPETQYTLKVKEISTEGESDWTTVDINTGKTIIVEKHLPGQPTGIRVTETSDDWIYITWDQPADDVRYYVVDYWTDDNEIQTINVERDDRGDFPEGVDLEGIEPGRTYTVRITAVNQNGDSRPTIQRITTEEVHVPTHHTISSIQTTDRSTVLSWTGPTDRVTNYRVTVLTANNQLVKRVNLNKQPDGYIPQHITIRNLNPSTEYKVILTTVYNTGDEGHYTVSMRTKPSRTPAPSARTTTTTEAPLTPVATRPTTTERVRPAPTQRPRSTTTRRPRPATTEAPVRRTRPTTRRPRPTTTEAPATPRRPRPVTTERPRPIPTTTTTESSPIMGRTRSTTTTEAVEVTTTTPRRTTTPQRKELDYNVRVSTGADFATIFFELNEAKPVDTFVIQYRPTSGSTNYHTEETPGDFNSRINVQNLRPDTEYTLYTTARSREHGTQSWKKFTFTTRSRQGNTTPTPDVPDKVDITESVTGTDRITITWEQPEDDVHHYVIAVQPTGTNETPRVVELPGNHHQVTIDRLYPDTTYTINVQPVAEDGRTGPWTPFYTKTEPDEVTEPTNLAIEQPTIDVRDEGLVINWPQPAFDGHFYIHYNADDETTPRRMRVPVYSHNGNNVKKTLITDLQPNKNYTLSTRNLGPDGKTAWTTWHIETTDNSYVISEPTDEFEVPRILDVKPGEDSVEIVWSGPTPTTDGYFIKIGTTDDERPQVINMGQPSTVNPYQRYIINGLRPDTVYKVSVHPYGPDITSDTPVDTTFETLPEEEEVPVAPNAPMDVRPVTITNTTANIVWSRATPNIKYYIVHYYVRGGKPQMKKVPTRGNQESIHLYNLLPNRDYIFRIKSIGHGGQSQWTRTSFRTAPTPSEPVFESKFTDITPADTSVDVSFTGPTTDNVRGYIVSIRRQHDSVFSRSFNNQPSHSFTVHGLSPMTTYTVYLTTYDVNEHSVEVTRTFTTTEPVPTFAPTTERTPAETPVATERTPDEDNRRPVTTEKTPEPNNRRPVAPEETPEYPDEITTVETPEYVDETTVETPEYPDENTEEAPEYPDENTTAETPSVTPDNMAETPDDYGYVPRGDNDDVKPRPDVQEPDTEVPEVDLPGKEAEKPQVQFEVTGQDGEITITIPEEEKEKFDWVDISIATDDDDEKKVVTVHKDDFNDVITLTDLTPDTTVQVDVVFTDDERNVVTVDHDITIEVAPTADYDETTIAPETVDETAATLPIELDTVVEDGVFTITFPESDDREVDNVSIKVTEQESQEVFRINLNKEQFDHTIHITDINPEKEYEIEVIVTDTDGISDEHIYPINAEVPKPATTTTERTPATTTTERTPATTTTERTPATTTTERAPATTTTRKATTTPTPSPEIDAHDIIIDNEGEVQIPTDVIDEIVNVRIEVTSPDEEGKKVYVIPGSDVTPTINIPGLIPGEDYEVTLVITDVYGNRIRKSFRITVIDVVTTTTGPQVSVVRDIYFEVTSDNGIVYVEFPHRYLNDISEITIKFIPNGDGKFKVIDLNGDDVTNEIVIPGLTKDEEYTLDIVTIDNNGMVVRKRTDVTVDRDDWDEPTPEPEPTEDIHEQVISTEDGVLHITFPHSDDITFATVTVTPQGGDGVLFSYGPEVIQHGIEIPDLRPETRYDVSVVTVGDDRKMKQTHHTVVMPTQVDLTTEPAPASRPAPRVVTVQPNEDDVTLEVSNPGPDYNEINIQLTDESGQVVQIRNYPVDEPIVLEGLKPDNEYTIEITAVDDDNDIQSEANTITVRTKPQGPLEKPIVSVRSDNTTAVVDFTGRTKNVGYYVIEYQNMHDERPRTLYLNHVDFSPTYQRVVIRNLLPGSLYNISVQAFNDVTRSEKTVVTHYIKEVEMRPEPRYNVKIMSVRPSNDHAILRWSSDVISPVRYVITISEVDSSRRNMVTFDAEDIEENQVTINELSPETTYRVTVTVKNDRYDIDSPPYQFRTLEESNVPMPERPTEFVDLLTTTTTVYASWSGNSDNVDEYVVLYQEAGKPWKPQIVTVRGEGNLPPFKRVRIHGLKPNTRYQIAVKASGPGGESSWLASKFTTRDSSYTSEPTPPPLLTMPTSVTYDVVAPTQVQFRINDDQELDFHEVKFSPETRPTEVRQLHTASGQQITLDQLVPGWTYRLVITGYRARMSSPSLETTFTTPERPLVQPRPEGPAFIPNFNTEVHPTSAEFTWTVPDNQEYRQIMLQYKEDRGDTQFQKILMRPEYEQYTIKYLTPDTAYRGKLTLIPHGSGPAIIHDFTFSTLSETPEANTMPVPTEPKPNHMKDKVATTTTEEPVPTTTTVRRTTTTTRAPTTTTTIATTTTTEPLPTVERVGLITIPGPGQTEISWVPTEVVDYYLVEYGPANAGPGRVIRVNGDDRSVNLNDLVPGREYHVRIISVYGDIQSVPATATFTAKMPGPTNLRVTPTAHHTVRVSWQHPHPDVTGTQVDYKLSSSNHFTTKVVNSDVTDLLIPFRSVDDRLELRMITKGRVDGRNVESLPSVYSVYLRVSNNTFGGHLVRVTDVTDNQASVLVSSEDINGGWIVTIYDQTNEIYESPIEYPGTTTRGHLPQLESGSSYTAVVRNADSGDEIGRAHFMTKVSAPDGVRVTNDDDGSIVMTWRRPENDINGYLIKYRPINSRNWKVVEVSSSKTEYEFVDLSPSTEYQVVIVPTYIDPIADQYRAPGMSTGIRFETPAREEYVVISQPRRPAQPRPPTDLQFPLTTSTTSRVTWTPSPDQVDTYSVTVLRRSDNHVVSRTSAPANSRSVVLTGLEPDTDYILQVQSVRSGQSSVTQRAMFRTEEASDVESTPVHSENGDGWSQKIATIKWDDVTGLNYQKYRVIAEPLDGDSREPLTWELSPSARSIRLHKLEPGVSYRVYVEGFVGGNWIRVIEEQTITPELQAPGNFRAIKSSLKTVTAAWNKPEHDITGYKLTYTVEGSNEPTTVRPAPEADDEKITISGLEYGRRYLLRLYSVKGDKISPPTNLYMDTTVPKPKKFNAIQATPNIIGMTWTKPYDEITHYTLRVVAPGGRELIHNLQLSSEETAYRIVNLQPDTRYRIYLTAWMGELASQPSYKSRHTSKHVSTVTGEGTETNNGYLVTWRGKSRTVDGWKVVIEPQDGSESYEKILDRFTKRIELNSLKNNVEYVVKIYPFSGSILGVPSVIRIPASSTNFISGHEEHSSTTTEWELNVPQVTTDSMTVRWPEPVGSSEIRGYRLQYKIASEPDSAFRDVEPQPQLTDSSAVIGNLEPGTVYTIKMTAIHSDGRQTELVINVNTPILPPSNFDLKKTDTSYLLTWDRPNTEITGYVLKYRITTDDPESAFTIIELGADQTSYELDSLVAGQNYEIRLVAKSGEYSSQVQSFKFVPEELSTDCVDRTTNLTYRLGESWVTTINEFRMKCTCSEPRKQVCKSDNYCQDKGVLYTHGQKWESVEDTGERKRCECIENVGFRCFLRNCFEGGSYYDEGAQWMSSEFSAPCVCECPEDLDVPCMTKCRRTSALTSRRLHTDN